MKNFNPRSHCRERRSRGGTFYYSAKISIHVPIAGNDIFGCPARSNAFSFQSTFPLQGTTMEPIIYAKILAFQSTFPLQGTTDGKVPVRFGRSISIHVPIEGNDYVYPNVTGNIRVFQSTFPLQGTTKGDHEGYTTKKDFNPRSHCRERQSAWPNRNIPMIFQSTFPLQGTTLPQVPHRLPTSHFNPRSHCRERRLILLKSIIQNYFNPRSHCRERPMSHSSLTVLSDISIHVPIAGNDYRKVSFRRI